MIWAVRAVVALKDRSAEDLLRLNSLDDPSRTVREACRAALYTLRFPPPPKKK